MPLHSTPRYIFFLTLLIFLRFSPYLGKGFVVFQRNKELLIGVGRRDFELGSAPAFPAVRVEIDWEEWHTTLSLSHSEL